MPGSDEESRERATDQAALRNLGVVLDLCAAGKLRCSEKTKRPSAATIRTVGEHLVDGDFYPGEPISTFAWPMVIVAGGLARNDGGRLHPTAKGRAAMQRPADSVRELWRRWLTHGLIDEFSRIEQIKGQRAANVLTAVKTRREVVGQVLAGCPADEWVAIDTLFATMRRKRLNPRVARNGRAIWKLYLGDAEHGSFGYADQNTWLMAEGRYTLAVLFEYAATLGLIDVCYTYPAGARSDFTDNWGGQDLDALSRYDGLQSIRLNRLGAYVLGRTDGYEANYADHHTSPTTRDELTDHAGQLTDHGATRLIECPDPDLAALIAQGPLTRSLCRPIGGRHLAVPAATEAKFRTAVRKLGFILPEPTLPEPTVGAGE